MWKLFLEKIVKFEAFDTEDIIAKLRFYYGENVKIADRDSILGQTLEELLSHTKYKIFGNEYLKARLMKECILPKVFGHIEFRRMEKQELSYQSVYDVSLATHDTEFHFKDDMEVFGFSLSFRGLKMKINKGYCSITVTVAISI